MTSSISKGKRNHCSVCSDWDNPNWRNKSPTPPKTECKHPKIARHPEGFCNNCGKFIKDKKESGGWEERFNNLYEDEVGHVDVCKSEGYPIKITSCVCGASEIKDFIGTEIDKAYSKGVKDTIKDCFWLLDCEEDCLETAGYDTRVVKNIRERFEGHFKVKI